MAKDIAKSGCGCSGSSTCCNQAPQIDTDSLVSKTQWITGLVSTPLGNVPQVSTRLQREDIFGSWKARWNIGRMDYKISPGLYAVGKPDPGSPVLVSANYKMSFDRLRQRLTKLSAWIMVIDTKGINVWCAAGKGTFGTEEIINRIAKVKLSEVVSHRTIILPQLGAPGVAAHEVQKASGFKVVYGPVRAKDLPKFIKDGQKATPKMRRVKFGLWDRLVLTPLELVGILKLALIGFFILFIINIIGAGWGAFFKTIYRSAIDFIPYLGALLVGTVLVPVLLPFIPGRPFAWKGWLLGLLWTIFYIWYSWADISWKQAVAYLMILPPISAYLAMNFTGSSTYTSLSGVLKEMKNAVPGMLISVGLGVMFLVVKWLVRF